jgi:hypothetical protein
MTPEEITDGWLSERFDSDVRITDRGRIGDGLVGMNLRLTLEAADSSAGVPRSLVVKLPSTDPTSRATGVTLRNYEREVKFYRELAPTIDMRLARCYYGDWTESDGDFVLLLEDLSPAEQGDQTTGCSAEQARTAVLELARLHGPRWNDPALSDIEWLGRYSPEGTDQLVMLWSIFLPGFMGTYAKYLDSEQTALVERFGARLRNWVEQRVAPYAITHGDYRLDNLMFGTAAGGSPVAAVDWQSPGHGPALSDVSYFLGAGPLPTVRREIERELVHDYGKALAEYGVHVDEAELWRQYRFNAYSGVVMSVVASQIVGGTERSEAMFAAMATRHTQHALDLDAESLL